MKPTALVVLISLAALVGSPLLAYAADSSAVNGYLCIPEHSTGYSVRSGKWQPTGFNVQGQKYLLREKNGKWLWTDFGEAPIEPQNLCETFNDLGFLTCQHFEVNVLFNRKTLRFQALHPYGYVVSDLSMDKKPITPYYQIGTCSPL